MGALTGRMSPLGFFVKSNVEDWDKVLDQMTRYRFQELDPATGAQQAFGWVELHDPFGTRFEKPSVFYGEHIVGLAMRVDSISVPASQVKLHLAKRVKERLAQEQKERLAKSELKDMKEALTAEMLRRALPTIKVYEMLYHTATGRLWFFGKSKGVVQTFLDLFYETFAVAMVPDSPYTAARELLTEEETDSLFELEQASFVSDYD
jgi:recombination associated protein RdgC